MTGVPVLEIACFSLESALIAAAAGADRIELCEDYKSGGITPSEDLIERVKKQVNIPLQVMIRPRAGDFVYSEAEIEMMERTILFCKATGINGVVFGVLTKNNQVDIASCERLTALSKPMSVTFHRAIDSCTDLKRAVKELINIGIDRILSAGRGETALAGLAELSILQKIFGHRICIMPGGGIRAANILPLLGSGCYEYHSSGITDGLHADAAEIRSIRQLLVQDRGEG